MNEQDREHLQLLSVFHYVVAGLAAIFSCIPIVHLAIGIGMVTGRFGAAKEPILRVIGPLLIVVATVLILSGWAFAILLAVAGTHLRGSRHYTFCLVMAGVACAFVPFGTVLGVLTIVVLSRPGVRAAFAPPTGAA